MKEGFMVPPNHVNFEETFWKCWGEIIVGSIAYISLRGGGPTEMHTHSHNHLFIVVRGEARVLLDDRKIIIHRDESFLVDGSVPHSVWSNQDEETVMIGISLKEQRN